MGGVGGNLIDLPRFHVTRCVVSFITRAMGVQKAKQTRARNKERSNKTLAQVILICEKQFIKRFGRQRRLFSSSFARRRA